MSSYLTFEGRGKVAWLCSAPPRFSTSNIEKLSGASGEEARTGYDCPFRAYTVPSYLSMFFNVSETKAWIQGYIHTTKNVDYPFFI